MGLKCPLDLWRRPVSTIFRLGHKTLNAFHCMAPTVTATAAILVLAEVWSDGDDGLYECCAFLQLCVCQQRIAQQCWSLNSVGCITLGSSKTCLLVLPGSLTCVRDLAQEVGQLCTASSVTRATCIFGMYRDLCWCQSVRLSLALSIT